ncbi:uncharacterized protein A4U43_C08F10700 [Asparagus officinalis]|uniref:thymidine kinase-like n=1 Tax=Asparagus officinalis TaxID=4686 RepID=UPI00098E52EB|nr:thymidine kinase-like [Asparagus officinalis]ONK59788.1 uncharacterized protein A4U43_C08F10700 [Asparagus officinalis]
MPIRSSVSIMISLLSSSLPFHHRQPFRLSCDPRYLTKPRFSLPIKLRSLHSTVRSHFSMPINGLDRSGEARCSSGEIHVIIGPMFAGKTTALLRRVQGEVDIGRKVAMIKSDRDTRYAIDSIVTHDGTRMRCLALNELSTFRTKLGVEAYDKLDVIGIDEAQFFEDLYDFCCNAADRDGKTVIVAGLDGDYLRKRFGSVLDIVPLAESVTKLTARCEICGRPAYFTLRKTEQKETELIGGADVYMPVCRQHYVNGQVVIETARLVLESKKEKLEVYSEAGSP